jgi:tRNA A-37 threonylcarbamoyl transferase component Bud32
MGYTKVQEDVEVYEKSIAVFEQNIVYINNEISAGEICLSEIERTKEPDGPACEEYIFKKEVSKTHTTIGINLLVALFAEGYLVEGEEEFEEILKLVEELAAIDQEAKDLNDAIMDRLSTKCTKCLI